MDEIKKYFAKELEKVEADITLKKDLQASLLCDIRKYGKIIKTLEEKECYVSRLLYLTAICAFNIGVIFIFPTNIFAYIAFIFAVIPLVHSIVQVKELLDIEEFSLSDIIHFYVGKIKNDLPLYNYVQKFLLEPLEEVTRTIKSLQNDEKILSDVMQAADLTELFKCQQNEPKKEQVLLKFYEDNSQYKPVDTWEEPTTPKQKLSNINLENSYPIENNSYKSSKQKTLEIKPKNISAD